MDDFLKEIMGERFFARRSTQYSRRGRKRTVKQQVKQQEAIKAEMRRNVDPRSKSIRPETYMDDVINMNKDQTPSDGVIFGVYGADDWVTCSHLRTAIESSKSTLAMDGTWITPAGWKLQEWAMKKSERFNFMSMQRVLLFMPWGIVEASLSRDKIEIEVNGDPKEVLEFISSIDKELKRAENLIEWVYGVRGESISVPLNYRKAIPGAYPWLPTDLDTYIDQYLNSQASVLILIGPPGVGKTTMIKNLIHRSKGDAKVTYDEKVMNDDSLFAGFIESDAKFLIMEDADAFLAKREDGNTMMHRFLNVSDGLISAQDKKMVFSTNLPSVKDIDSALLRPGRCFDVVEFRPLTRKEALLITEELGLSLPDGAEFTLAELFNVQPSGAAKSLGKKIGF